MKKGNIKFIYEDGKTPLLEIELANNNLWLTKYEIAHLFNCFVPKVDANLRSIFKDNLLWEDDCTCNYRYTDKGIEKQCLYYNLEVLISLSYYTNTLEAKIFRQFVHTALREYLRKDKLPANIKFNWLSQSQPSYLWN
jgi:hypothetical protein